MINGNASEFIDELTYQDHYVNYRGHNFFFNGCQYKRDENGNIITVALEVYNLTTNKTIFSTTKNSTTKCIDAFEKAKIWGGKTFWEVEKDMEWVE
ncbi:MAG: hypothetical protein ACI3XS_01915 [Eubacteriales bacterium]